MVLSMVLLSGCTLATIRSLEDDEVAKEGFVAEKYVESIWESEFMPAMESGAVEIVQLLSEIDASQTAATTQYGNRTSTGAYSFMTRGEAQILNVNRESRVGLAALDLAPYDGTADVYLAIGPVLRGNALRDAVRFIAFNDFTNQVEFAQVSDALKQRIADQVLATTDLDALVGQTIRFMGAFTLEDRDEVVIMPVQLEAVQ
jgi:predicted lipoprotein